MTYEVFSDDARQNVPQDLIPRRVIANYRYCLFSAGCKEALNMPSDEVVERFVVLTEQGVEALAGRASIDGVLESD